MLRKLNPTDLPYLVAMEIVTQAAPWSEETFKHCINLGCDGWVMEQYGAVVGFVIVVTSTKVAESHILNLCVDPLHQRQGFGRDLLQYALEQAKQQGVGTVYLEVRRSNHRAITLYHKMGFSQISERKGYYPSPEGREDALVFAKDLGVKNPP
jgi:ribosomal-protein-alanine N-acetyltransferase